MKKILLAILVVAIFLAQCSATASKRSFGEVVDDNVILVKLKTKFSKDKIVQSRKIHIKVRKGVVTLKGFLDNQDQINRSIEIAEQQRGVSEVKAYLVLKEFTVPTVKKHQTKKSFWSVFNKDKKQKTTETIQVKDITEEGTVTNLDQKSTENVKEKTEITQKTEDYQDFEF